MLTNKHYKVPEYNLPPAMNYSTVKGRRVKPKKFKTPAEVSKEYNHWRKSPEFEDWKKRQISKQNYLCYYCLETLKGKRMNVEHIIPRSKGGDNRIKNLVLACATCNKKKGATLYTGVERGDFHNKFYTHRNRLRAEWFKEQEAQRSEEEIALWIASWV